LGGIGWQTCPNGQPQAFSPQAAKSSTSASSIATSHQGSETCS
jgi:hypothetical protein